jgi:primosomal protein N' (replication factor Y) (superfamily II helicase)
MHNKIAEVYLNIRASDKLHAFDYSIPDDLITSTSVGSLVLVPFRKRDEVGFIGKIKTKTSIPHEGLKKIKRILIERPLFDEKKLKLASWLSFYYLCPMGRVLSLFIPPGFHFKIQKRLIFSKHAFEKYKQEYPFLNALDFDKPLEEKHFLSELQKINIDKNSGARIIKDLAGKKIITRDVFLKEPHIDLRFEDYVQASKKTSENILEKIPKKSTAQRRAIEYLLGKGQIKKSIFFKEAKISAAVFNILVQKKCIEITKKRAERIYEYLMQDEKYDAALKLNPYQEDCVKNIGSSVESSRFHAYLIEGITGSGKTEVYIECAKRAIAKKRKALILIPEISLTPLIYSRFKKIFKEKVAVYHSKMSEPERYERWADILNDRYDIIIGTRSALFTPIKGLGLIILDEEHDPSYKEGSNLRYNSQDVALKMAKLFKIPVVYGSATPSLVMRYKAQTRKDFTMLKIPIKAAGNSIAKREVIDLRKIDKSKQDDIVTNRLFMAMKQEIEKKNRIILFINRRGYSNYVLCRDCGHIPKCPSCDLSYTLHLKGKKLLCHHCNLETKYYGKCLACGSIDVIMCGVGIQKVESKIRQRFGAVPVYRMDSDSMSGKKSHEKIFNDFMRTSPSILLGTQMVTKGLDVDNVTVVGVLYSDYMLALPDYHMDERVFQTFTQVAGRAARKNLDGVVMIQTYNPDSDVVRSFIDSDYDAFYRAEIKKREELSYPPFTNIINLIVSGKTEESIKKDAHLFYDRLKDVLVEKDLLLGPAPAPFYKLNNDFRYHILIKSFHIAKSIVKYSKTINDMIKKSNNKIIVDVDPSWIL